MTAIKNHCLKGDTTRGQLVLSPRVPQLPQLKVKATDVGPSLENGQNTVAARILIHVLDPTAKSPPTSSKYVLRLTDGRVLPALSPPKPTPPHPPPAPKTRKTTSSAPNRRHRLRGKSLCRSLRTKITPKTFADLIQYLRSN